MGCAKPSMLLPYQPYLVGRRPTRHDQAILARLQPLPRALVDISFAYGSDNTHALAAIGARLSGYGAAMTGAATDVYRNRMGRFVKSMEAYQAALLGYRSTRRAGATASGLALQKSAYCLR